VDARLDAVVAGVAVVDIIGRPVVLSRLPRQGGLTLIDSITMTTGGNVANCGTDLAKMGFRVGAITRVGDDALGAHFRSELSSHGIEMRAVRTIPGEQTSATLVAVGPDGERTFLHTRGALKRFRVRDMLEELELIGRARFFLFGYYGLLPECDAGLARLLHTVREHTGAATLLDTGGNPRRNDRRLATILPHLDYFLPSLDEARVLTGRRSPQEIVRCLRAMGARGTLGVKLGSRGCYLDVEGEARLIAPRAVRRIVDATGAGDAFVAGFVAARISGRDPFTAAEIGNRVAADCIRGVGASTTIGSYSRYDARAGKRRPRRSR
jgi:sugar/nucleoside kinase (ribokinase family)